MKISKIFSALALVGVLALFSSCGSTCFECVKDSVTEEVCDQDLLGVEIPAEDQAALLELDDYTCTEK